MVWKTLSVPPGHNLSEFHHSNTMFPFVIGPGFENNPLSWMFNGGNNPTGQNPMTISIGEKMNSMMEPDQTPEKEDSINQPKDENWEYVQSVTETSLTSSYSITDTTEDERTLSEMRSSDFGSMGDTYSASEESTEDDSFESDATFNSQEDSEASELTDYENFKNELNNTSSKKTKKVTASRKDSINKLSSKNKLSKHSSKKTKEVSASRKDSMNKRSSKNTKEVNALYKDSKKKKSSKKSRDFEDLVTIQNELKGVDIVDGPLPKKNKKSKKRMMVERRVINNMEYYTNDPSLYSKVKFPKEPDSKSEHDKFWA